MVRYTALAAGAFALTATAAAQPIREHDHSMSATSKLRASYSEHRDQVVRRYGKRAPGRDIVRDGVRDGVRATDRQVRESDGVLVRMLEAPARRVGVPVLARAAAVSQGASAPRAGGGGGVPAELQRIAQCESHGNYHAVNPSSGAYGKYQVLPSTARAYHCNMATPAGQDACAVRIYAGGAGRSQWVC